MSISLTESPQEVNGQDSQVGELVDKDKALVLADAQSIDMDKALEYKEDAKLEEKKAEAYGQVAVSGSFKGLPKGLAKPTSPDFARLMSKNAIEKADILRKKEQNYRRSSEEFADEVSDAYDSDPSAAEAIILDKKNDELVAQAEEQASTERSKILFGPWDDLPHSGTPSERTIANRGGRLSARY